MTDRKTTIIEYCVRTDAFITGDDGFKVFWPKGLNGALAAHDLRIIADELSRLNEPRAKQVEEDLKRLEGLK